MSKIAERKALQAYPYLNEERRKIYVSGYDQAAQDFMKKAKAWFIQQHTGMFNSFKQYVEQL
jgi:hypothetical protein